MQPQAEDSSINNLQAHYNSGLHACRVLDETVSEQREQREQPAQQQQQQAAQARPHVVRPTLMQRTDSERTKERTLCLDNIGGIWRSDAELEAALRPYTPYLQVGQVA